VCTRWILDIANKEDLVHLNRQQQIASILIAISILMPSFAVRVQGHNDIGTAGIGLASTSDRLGAFLIICGDRGDHHLVNKIWTGGDRVYDTIRGVGFPASNIYYLGPTYNAGLHSYDNASATRANIQWAIETWAATRVSATRGLGIYLFDHGGVNAFCLGGLPDSDMTPTSFDTWLDALQTSSGCNRVALIYEACESGSFINEISQDNRIICTATDDTHGSSINPAGDWATFSEPFWGAIADGSTIGNAFIDACYFVVDSGHGGDQFPWIDDNHDGVGHRLNTYGALPNSGDGSDALTTKILYAPTFTLAPAFKVVKMMAPSFFAYASNAINFWVEIQNSTRIKSVVARIIPPGWQPTAPSRDGDGFMTIWPDAGVVNKTLTDPNGDGNWTGSYTPMAAHIENGTYRVVISASSEDGTRFTSEATSATVTADGLPPADTTAPTVWITTPFDSEVVSNVISITAEADDDQEIVSLAIQVDGTAVETLTNPTYPYQITATFDTANKTHTITAVATDGAGHSTSHSITINPASNDLITWIIIIGCGAGVLALAIFIQYVRNKKRKAGK
jgi:hypothetical protein